MRANRRTFIRTVGIGVAGAFVASGSAAASDGTEVDAELAEFDLDGGPHEALVVFASRAAVDRLDDLDTRQYRKCRVLPIGYGTFTGDQLRTVAGWEETLRVTPNRELEYHNDRGRELTGAEEVQGDLGYTGEAAEVAVLDTGVNGSHPDLEDNLAANYQIAGDPVGQQNDGEAVVEDVGPADTDDVGHGTHVIGSIAGAGDMSDGQYRGMAPDATVYSYSTNVSLYLFYAVEAYDHLTAQKLRGNTDVAVVSNSWGSSSDDDFDPFNPINVATWEAHRAGILSVFSAGNSGPDYDTLNDYAKAPHVLCVAATNFDQEVTDFSSRGRPRDDPDANYDRKEAYENLQAVYGGATLHDVDGPVGLYRNGVGATGDLVMSTLSPYDPLQAYAADEEVWYGRVSGTSMSCPTTSGCLALAVDAARQNGEDHAPLDVLNTAEAEAVNTGAGTEEAGSSVTDPVLGGDEVPDDEYTPANIGAGFVNAVDLVERAADGRWASFGEVKLVDHPSKTPKTT